MKKTKFSDLKKGKIYFNKNYCDHFLKFVEMRNDYLAKFIVCDYNEDLCEFVETEEIVYLTAGEIADFIL